MPKLFMLLIGCTPPGRFIEQHDIFFGIGESIKDLIPGAINHWPEAGGKLHLDAWREITRVNGYRISVVSATDHQNNHDARLFFINLGGYKQNEFEEFHYKMVVVADNKAEAIRQSKQTAFYRHTGFDGANSHIDDKYGIDVDDIFEIADILGRDVKNKFRVIVTKNEQVGTEDEIHLGYFKLSSFG